MRQQPTLYVLPLILMLAGCEGGKPDREESAAAENIADAAMGNAASEDSVNAAAAHASRSIIRPSVVQPATPPKPEPAAITIPFPDRGMKLDEAGQGQIDALLEQPIMAEKGPIVLRGHSDARGSDADNLVASRHRAEAVRDYLLAKGVAADRITVIALGEYRPVAPSAKPDGSDDPDGRAKNRRVEMEVGLPPADTGAAPADEKEE
ncbi:MAG: OmpA family protein [Sphingobium sp.]